MQETPTNIKVKRMQGVLEVSWSDGGVNRYRLRNLRCACRCAGCVDEHTGVRTLDVDAVPDDLGVNDMKQVGNYAVQFTFTDGHDTGIFTWEHLRELATEE